MPGPWARLAERRHRAASARDFRRLVATIRSGPPLVFRIGWVREVPNLNEFFVHHEDVRRANGHGPRVPEPDLADALWANVGRAPWVLARRLRGAGLVACRAGTTRTVRVRRGEPTAMLTGAPGEVLLYLFGRKDAAQVDLTGPEAAVRAVRDTRLGV